MMTLPVRPDRTLSPALSILALAVTLHGSTLAQRDAQQVQRLEELCVQRHRELEVELAERREELENWASEHGFPEHEALWTLSPKSTAPQEAASPTSAMDVSAELGDARLRKSYLRRLESTREAMARAHADFAEWCRRVELHALAHEHAERAIALEEDCRAARRLLRHVRHRGRWLHEDELSLLRQGLTKTAEGTWLSRRAASRLERGASAEEVHRASRDAALPLELRSTHVVLRTSLPYDEALATLQRMESASSWLPVLVDASRERETPIEVYWCSSAEELARVTPDFDGDARCVVVTRYGKLYTYAPEGRAPRELAASRLLHALIDFDPRHGGLQKVYQHPGLGVFLGATMVVDSLRTEGGADRLRRAALRPFVPWARELAQALGPRGLDQLVSFDRFPEEDTDRWWALSSLYVAFLLDSDDLNTRLRAERLLREVVRGRGESDSFEQILGRSASATHEEFLSYLASF